MLVIPPCCALYTIVSEHCARVMMGLALALALLLLGTPFTLQAQSAPVAPVKTTWGTPCCGITAIDTRTGIVSAKVTATSRVFRFGFEPLNGATTGTGTADQFEPLNGVRLLSTLKIGQKIYANFATGAVSLDGIQPCCAILK